MTSLAEVYGSTGSASLRRLYFGTGIFIASTVLIVSAILIASTDVLAFLSVGTFGARRIAGILAGLGVPGVLVGIFTVLPASRRERATAAIGASVCIFGVVLFAQVYPSRWYGATADHLTLPVAVVYFIGVITVLWALFTAIANFKTRNDPGGTVTIKRTIGGETRYVDVPVSELEGKTIDELGTGGVGVLGTIDRDAVEADPPGNVIPEETAEIINTPGTQTGRDAGGSPASDGGTMPSGAPSSATTRTSQPTIGPPDTDRYCGNCFYFEYAQMDTGIVPYCGYNDTAMDDLDPCQHWKPNTPS